MSAATEIGRRFTIDTRVSEASGMITAVDLNGTEVGYMMLQRGEWVGWVAGAPLLRKGYIHADSPQVCALRVALTWLTR